MKAARISSYSQPNGAGLDPTVYVLEIDNARLEICPALGFNAFRWRVGDHELLYADERLFEEAKPTRSGFPILFPFPNRIRAGRFDSMQREFQLACNDPAGKNAIHGFACYSPWRTVEQWIGADSLRLTGEFEPRLDAPHVEALWPSPYVLRVSYELRPGGLRVRAEVRTMGPTLLPFGLGYHPYFRLEPFGATEAIVRVPASSFWELEENLPTGRVVKVDARRDLRDGQRFADMQLDDVLTGIGDGWLGEIHSPDRRASLRITGSPRFREMVVFTPPHRRAVCLEPYTCTTDAINLEARGIDVGWQVIGPGETWVAHVDLEFATEP